MSTRTVKAGWREGKPDGMVNGSGGGIVMCDLAERTVQGLREVWRSRIGDVVVDDGATE
jgi:hypothetical protein